jgi:hypothetical protein
MEIGAPERAYEVEPLADPVPGRDREDRHDAEVEHDPESVELVPA